MITEVCNVTLRNYKRNDNKGRYKYVLSDLMMLFCPHIQILSSHIQDTLHFLLSICTALRLYYQRLLGMKG